MPSKEISEYFDATENRDTRNDLKLAVKLVDSPKIAIDCGCGSGSDIAYLRTKEFHVHAFDIEEEAIKRCESRFSNDKMVALSQSAFDEFRYPSASLIVADSSLCFCPEDKFDEVWDKITHSLLPGGVFVGSFLGVEDSMAGSDYKKEAYWPDVLITSEEKVMRWFREFKIEAYHEHKSSGVGHDGEPQSWHRYSIVAQKKSNKLIKKDALKRASS